MANNSEGPIEVKVIVTGQVQGVWYRAHTHEAAQKRPGISGYVKNRSDGTVEAVFQGSRPDVDVMIEWCWTGSPNSSVTGVNVDPRPGLGEYNGFEIRY